MRIKRRSRLGSRPFHTLYRVPTVICLCFVFVTFLQTFVESVKLEDDTPFDTDVVPPKKYCVDALSEDLVCSKNPRTVRLSVESDVRDMHMGVVQRIDGNQEEKNGIINVLKLMNIYWHEEVLSNDAYASVRKLCKNKNELCAFWSAIGECESNRVFMLSNCAASCRFCLLLSTNLPTW